MKNKILFLIILILTMSLSCAFGYSPDDILADLTTLRDRGLMTGIPTDYQNNSAWQNVLYSYSNSGYANGNFTGYFIAKTSATSSLFPSKIFVGMIFNTTVGVTTSIKSNNVASNNSLYYTWSGFNGNTKTYGLTSSMFQLSGANGSSGTFDYDKATWDYFYVRDIPINTRTWVQEANTEYGGSYLTGPTFEFDPYDVNGYITVYGSGESAQFIRRPFSYSNIETRLGYITNIDDYYYLEGKFGPFVTPNIVDAQYGFIKNQVGTYNGKLGLNVNGEILINTAKLVNNQGYSLYFIYKMSPDDDYHYSDYYYYYTYKYGSNPTSGDVVSSELESNIDIGMVNALDDFFDYTSGDAENIDYILGTEVFNFGFSGDILSGDFLSGEIIDKLGFNDYTKSNRYSLFIYNTYRNILSVLNSSDLNSSISFSLYGNNYTFNSSQFALPSGPIKTLVSTFVYVLFIGCFIRFMHSLYLKLSVFDINGFVSSFDSDHSIFM